MRIYRPKFKNRQGEIQTCRVYWVQANVNRKLIRKSLGTRDKRVAEMRALQMIEKEERKAVGLASPFEEHADRPLKEHIDEFLAFLKSRGVSKEHHRDRAHSLSGYLEMTKANTLPQIDLVEAQHWLAELAERLSARTVNKRLASLRQFGNWLVRTRRWSHNPFEGLTPRNEETDRRRVRRALTDEEVDRLLDAARRRPLERARLKRTRTGVTPPQEAKLRRLGETRAYLYLFALGTGLRKGELRGLTWADVDEDRRTFTVRASISKAKTQAELPLRSDIAVGLAEHRARVEAAGFGTGPQDRLFPGRLFPTHGTVNADLKHAGLDDEDDQGRVTDFHSLRVTMISRLSAAGVHPRTAQALARHSKLELTMRTYTDVRLLDLRGALEVTASPQGGIGRHRTSAINP